MKAPENSLDAEFYAKKVLTAIDCKILFLENLTEFWAARNSVWIRLCRIVNFLVKKAILLHLKSLMHFRRTLGNLFTKLKHSVKRVLKMSVIGSTHPMKIRNSCAKTVGPAETLCRLY